jgi:hypothetical protein
MVDWEDRYIGTWTDGNGHRIEIRKVKHREFLVSFFRNDSPVLRPWMDDQPSTDMRAKYFYDTLDGSDFIVELSGSDNRYSLHLSYEEYDYLLPKNGEILSTAVSGPEHGDHRIMDDCSSRFLCVNHFHRVR